jgi:hypothetical protein
MFESEKQITKEEIFVGKNYDSYNKRWGSMKKRNSNLSWNWSIFLFGPLWLGYRKLHLYAILYILIDTLTSFVTKNSFGVYIGVQGISFIMWVGLAIMGNYLYQVKTNKAINTISNEDELKRQGGTNAGFVFLYIVVLLIINITIAYQSYSNMTIQG